MTRETTYGDMDNEQNLPLAFARDTALTGRKLEGHASGGPLAARMPLHLGLRQNPDNIHENSQNLVKKILGKIRRQIKSF